MKESEIVQLVERYVAIPQTFEWVACQKVAHGDRSVLHVRFVKDKEKGYQWGGEHFSLTIDLQAQRLMGLMHLERELETNVLIDEDKAKSITFAFLQENAPDLLDTVEVRWIKPTLKIPLSPPHDEGFKLNNGSIITGMRVKLWANDTKKYAWIIVHASGQIISFERDIVWSTLKHCRTTERWLHDDWLQSLDQKMDAPCLQG